MAVETKLSKVIQEFGTRLDSHCKAIEAIPTKVPDLTTTIVNVTSSLATEQKERERCQLSIMYLSLSPLILMQENRRY